MPEGVRLLSAGTGLVLVLAAAPAWAQDVAGPLPEEGRYIGRVVPDLEVRTTAGASRPLSSYWQARPLLLALVFTRCAGTCSPLLASLARAEEQVGGSGEAYATFVLSFDPRDGPADMGGMAALLGLGDDARWTFGVAHEGDVRRLAEAIGFWYAWDGERGQFDHPGMLVALRGGRVLRLLVGTQVEPARLHEVVRELRGDFVAAYPLPGRVLFRCFEYRADTGELRLDWGFLILLVPGMLAAAATLALFGAGRREREQERHVQLAPWAEVP
ncbi:MAG TPA: SCO family protein [Vicinamibacteria bacterium]|nr:SCO family protein [Vicinamibacteria bacterium]